jgi:hypothetical protein
VSFDYLAILRKFKTSLIKGYGREKRLGYTDLDNLLAFLFLLF